MARLRAAELFSVRCGGRAAVLVRFLPFVRTYTPLAAGTAHLPYRTFLIWTVTVVAAWGAGLALPGAWLGSAEFTVRNIGLVLIVAAPLGMLRCGAKYPVPGIAATIPGQTNLPQGNPEVDGYTDGAGR
ncbi:DedA family protein [Paenarthrobacter nicotinovorans]|uniref:DedA family protein n=1 Tax=Paenarthrobacter nicotinovorans TaxID=29320 RepID=UPI0011A1B82B|nr:hypothetical protein [Paenarthrobacter nicotinovorans]